MVWLLSKGRAFDANSNGNFFEAQQGESMAIKHAEEYRDPVIAKELIRRIKNESKKSIRLMEVCGTHTMSIFRSGIRQVIPPHIVLLSGPGCPVCVTAQWEIDAFVALSKQENVVVATFGDLMRVPGAKSSLQKERASGKDVRMVYSTSDAIDLARKNPDKKVVFLGVGFETTAPTVAASIFAARQEGLGNYFVYCAHKLVPPALAALLESEDVNIDGFILPGHVSVIIGVRAYRPVFEKYKIPSAVAGFEPVDILRGIEALVNQIESARPALENAYPRAVTDGGNKKAIDLMNLVFETTDADWRGIGTIKNSGLRIRDEFGIFDATKVFALSTEKSPDPKGCACGDVLKGVLAPPECALYKKACSPASPVGPCMVSSEGTCAAYYRYHNDD